MASGEWRMVSSEWQVSGVEALAGFFDTCHSCVGLKSCTEGLRSCTEGLQIARKV